MPPAKLESPRLPRFAQYPQLASIQASLARASPSHILTTSCDSESYVLGIRQQPEAGKAMGSKTADRKPVDPPPIISLYVRDPKDPTQNYLQSPYYMCICTLWHASEERAITAEENNSPPLAGTLVSSLHRLKDIDNQDKGFFVFGDISVRLEGDFRLKFVLFEMMEGEAVSLAYITSSPFTVHPPKSFPGLRESSFISRSFGDQCVRLRIRKDGRASSKRGPKSQAVGEENGYETKAQPTVTTGDQHTVYADTSPYARGIHGLPATLKRQRTSTDLGSNQYEREWYSSAPSSAGIYPSSTGSISTYAQESVCAPQGIGYYRANESQLPHTPSAMYTRNSLGDLVLPQGQQQLTYRTQNYGHSDPSANIDQYSDSTYASMHDPNAGISPTSHNSQSLRSEYSNISDQPMKPNYRVTVPSNAHGSNLPPMTLNTPASSMSSGSSAHSAYPFSYPDTTRTFQQPGAQSNMRAGYNGYPGHYSTQTPYQSSI